MFVDGEAYTSVVEEETVMFREPMENVTEDGARLRSTILTEVLKAYDDMDAGNET